MTQECYRCGFELKERVCKLYCPNCMFSIDCSDA